MPLKIYYLDDENDLLEMFSDTFSSANRSISTFSDPNTAMEAVRQNPPDILFIDYRLPNYTGDQIAQELDPKLPKVLITGDMQVNSKYKFLAVFEKPYRTSQIEDLLDKLEKGPKAL
jgi:DNA-binding NtrC family response regulator